MANANRGEVAFSVEDKEYTLRFSANALCDLEDALNMPILQITELMSDPKKMSVKVVRAMLWAGLKELQPKITILEAGDLVQKLTVAKTFVTVGEAFQKAFPTDTGDVNPQKLDGQGGTGPAYLKVG